MKSPSELHDPVSPYTVISYQSPLPAPSQSQRQYSYKDKRDSVIDSWKIYQVRQTTEAETQLSDFRRDSHIRSPDRSYLPTPMRSIQEVSEIIGNQALDVQLPEQALKL